MCGHAVWPGLMTGNARMITKSCICGGMALSNRFVGTGSLMSASCGLADLVEDGQPISASAGEALDTGAGWVDRWTTAWKVSGGKVVCPVRDLALFPISGCEPVRRFSWRRGQHHRPGLQFMVSTGQHHGFESLEEARLLLAVDFMGAAQVVCQPFRLRFTTVDGPVEHVPDVLAVTRGDAWLIDVRPRGRIGVEDRVKFAAAAEAALAAGWRYLVASGWRPHVMETLDTLSSQRRPLTDPLGLADRVLAGVSSGPASFGELAVSTIAPPIARAHLLHLLWHRRLSIDLARPLTDATPVHPVAGR